MAAELHRRAAEWLAGNDTGISSETMCFWLVWGTKCDRNGYPHDPADLGRCLRLLERIPELRAEVPRMAELGPVWAAYVARWGEMEAAMNNEVGIDWSKGHRAPLTYDLMHQIADGAR